MSELKPCPFCGEEIYSEFYSHRAEEFDGHCTNKKCVLYGKELLFFNTARWNSRPIEDQLRAENEKLRKILENIITTDVVEITYRDYRGQYPVEFAVMNLQQLVIDGLKEVTK